MKTDASNDSPEAAAQTPATPFAAYAEHGWSLCALEPNSKRATEPGWPTARVAKSVAKRALQGKLAGAGLLHGLSGTCAVDIDDLAGAATWLAERGVDVHKLLDDPLSVRIHSGRENRAKLLYRVPAGMQLRTHQVAGMALELRCGTAHQDVLPPSIHPDTGRPYEWIYGEPLAGSWERLPELPAELLAVWQGLEREPAASAPPPRCVDVGLLRLHLTAVRKAARDDYEDWLRVGMALHHETDGGAEGLELWDEWSAVSHKYAGHDDLAHRWEGFGQRTGGPRATLSTLESMADPSDPECEAARQEANAQECGFDATVAPFTAFDVCDLRALRAHRQLSAEAPPAWWWRGYMPPGQVTLLGGHGGAGKSTLGLLLAAAATLGQPCLGQPTRPARVVFYSGEDPADVVEERLERITACMGWDFDAVAERLLVLDATVKDPALFREQRDRASFSMRALPTATFGELRRFVELHQADLLVIDNASDAFDGDENARAQVRTFIRGLASLVRPRGGAVLLFAHVDKLAARLKGNAGDNYSGSTAWHNSVRSRLFLMDTTDEKRRRPGDPTTLDLSHEKCNLGPRQPTVRLLWARNEAPKLAGATAVDAEARRDEDDMLALVRLVSEVIERGGWVPTADQGAKTANTVLKAERGCPSGRTSAEIHRLLREAERAGLLEGVTFEDKAQRKHRMGWRVTEAGVDRLAALNGAL